MHRGAAFLGRVHVMICGQSEGWTEAENLSVHILGGSSMQVSGLQLGG